LKSRFHLARLAAILSLPAAFSLGLSGDARPEDELKSATLLAFVQNAHWAGELPANNPLTVGVVGRAAFTRWLETSSEGKSVNGRPLRILAINGPIDPRCCQVMYFATDKREDIKPVMQSLVSAHVLTIGETDGFLALGGAVNLFLLDGHMAFEVSLSALDRAGVEISSKLLRFGQIRDLGRGRPSQ
jgi:hypothetical protein